MSSAWPSRSVRLAKLQPDAKLAVVLPERLRLDLMEVLDSAVASSSNGHRDDDGQMGLTA